MLARVVTRPAVTIRRSSQLQRRFIHPSRSQLQALPRPNTWLAKIRFRADGQPRSKLIALGFGSISLFNLLLVDTLFDLMEEGRKTETLLEMIIFVQRTDFTYDSVNFDDPISNLSYYKKLFQCFKEESVEETDQTFQELMEGYKMKTKEGSTNSAEVQALHIMRSAAEKIHDALRDVNRDSFLITAQFVFLVMQEAGGSLLDLLTDDDDDGDSSENDLKLVHNKNDTFSKDYEVLG